MSSIEEFSEARHAVAAVERLSDTYIESSVANPFSTTRRPRIPDRRSWWAAHAARLLPALIVVMDRLCYVVLVAGSASPVCSAATESGGTPQRLGPTAALRVIDDLGGLRAVWAVVASRRRGMVRPLQPVRRKLSRWFSTCQRHSHPVPPVFRSFLD
jgi:hypothetical protein